MLRAAHRSSGVLLFLALLGILLLPTRAFARPDKPSHQDNGKSNCPDDSADDDGHGGGSFADNAVGFLGDYVVYVTTDSDTTHAGYNRDKNGNIIYNNGQPTYSVRFGDYYSVRNSVGPNTTNGRGVGYSTLGYAAKTNQNGKKCVDVGCYVVEHYVQFGRFGELIPNPPPPPPR